MLAVVNNFNSILKLSKRKVKQNRLFTVERFI